MKKNLDISKKKCKFEKNGVCYAYACYSNTKCEARDKNGNIRYAVIKKSTEEEETMSYNKKHGTAIYIILASLSVLISYIIYSLNFVTFIKIKIFILGFLIGIITYLIYLFCKKFLH